MSESIRNLLQGVPDKRTVQVLERALDAARADSVALRASLVTVKADLDAERASRVLLKADVDAIQAWGATLLADLTAVRTAVTGITAKLDLDAGVTDENYASGLDPAALTTSAIAAITTTAPAAVTTAAPAATTLLR
jgi:hypothetical protein